MEEKKQKAIEILRKYNQEHIITWMEKQDDEIKEQIINQVIKIDLKELEDLYRKVQRGIIKKDYKIKPIIPTNKDKLNNALQAEYLNIGESVIKNGQYAVVTMAGGQGTRLRT